MEQEADEQISLTNSLVRAHLPLLQHDLHKSQVFAEEDLSLHPAWLFCEEALGEGGRGELERDQREPKGPGEAVGAGGAAGRSGPHARPRARLCVRPHVRPQQAAAGPTRGRGPGCALGRALGRSRPRRLPAPLRLRAAAGRGTGRTGKRPPLRPPPLCPSALAQRCPGIKRGRRPARSGPMEMLRWLRGGRPVRVGLDSGRGSCGGWGALGRAEGRGWGRRERPYGLCRIAPNAVVSARRSGVRVKAERQLRAAMSAGSLSSLLGCPGWREAFPVFRQQFSRLEERMSSRDPCESGYLSLGRALSREEGVGPTVLGMEPVGSPTQEPPDSLEMQLKVDFFRKLGYSSEEIYVVLQKLGLNADTNTVLGELVKHGPAEREPTETPQETKEAPLVPRGGAANKTPAPVPPLEEKESDNLKPIVIDGSNVAMRCVWGLRVGPSGVVCA